MSRRKPRGRGRPLRLLEPDMQKRLLDATRTAVPLELAAQHSGVSSRSLMRWLARGRDEQEHREDGGEPNEAEQPYLDLFQQMVKARADAATRNVGLIQKVAQGGTIVEESTRTYRDPETGEKVTETVVKRTPPDWRAAAWYLERSHRGQFGKDAVQVELITGENGQGQAAVGGATAEEVASRVRENLAAALADAQRLALPASTDPAGNDAGDDIEDAEIVEG